MDIIQATDKCGCGHPRALHRNDGKAECFGCNCKSMHEQTEDERMASSALATVDALAKAGAFDKKLPEVEPDLPPMGEELHGGSPW